MEVHKSLANEIFMYKGSLQYGPLTYFVICIDQYSNQEKTTGYYTKITRTEKWD